MNEFVKILLSLSISGTLLFFLLKLLKPLYRERFSRRWQYYIWLVVALRFLIPFSLETALMNRIFTGTEAAVQEYEERTQAEGRQEAERSMSGPDSDGEIRETAGQTAAGEAVWNGAGAGGEAEREISGTVPSAEGNHQGQIRTVFWEALFLIWLAAAVFLFLFKIRAYRSFTHSLTKNHEEVSEGKERELLDLCERAMRLKTKVRLYHSAEIASPVLLGVWKPALILPEGKIPEETLIYVFRHELTHCRRRDGLYKWLIQLIVCVHWFNPFIYRLEKETGQACELACDEAVLSALDRTERRKYGDMLIAFAGPGSCSQSAYASSALSEGGEHLKERLGAIMKFRKETKWAVAASAAALLMLTAGAVWLGSYTGLQRGEQGENTDLAGTEGVQDGPAENTQSYPADKIEDDGTETVPVEKAADGVHLELISRKDAYPYVELNFRIIEETGEPRIFPSDPADIPVEIEFDMEEPAGWGCSSSTTEEENDTIFLSFWSTEAGSATVTIDDLPYTVTFSKEEPEEIVLNREIAVYGGTAMLDSVLVYPSALTVNLSELDFAASQNTAFILAEEGTVYGGGNYLEGYIGYTGEGNYSGGKERWTHTYAFPDGFPENKTLVFRVINLRERDNQGVRLYNDYSLDSTLS